MQVKHYDALARVFAARDARLRHALARRAASTLNGTFPDRWLNSPVFAMVFRPTLGTAPFADVAVRHSRCVAFATSTRKSGMKTFFSTEDRSRTIDASRVVHDASRHARNGLYLGHDARGWHYADGQHSVLVLGPPRSGKTSALLIPNVLSAPGAVVTTSTKPDVLDATLGTRSSGGTCHLFDPSGSVADRPGVHRLRWSPLPACTSWRTALMTARSLVVVGSSGPGAVQAEASHWTERAQALLAPLLHAAAIDGNTVGPRRNLTMPGLAVTVGEQIAA